MGKIEIQKVEIKNNYFKGVFKGQYSGYKDRVKALNGSEQEYYDITIDNGELFQVEIIEQFEYDLVNSDKISSQSRFKSVNAYASDDNFLHDGYKLEFDEVKIQDVKLNSSGNLSSNKRVGDLECSFYGIIKSKSTITEVIDVTDQVPLNINIAESDTLKDSKENKKVKNGLQHFSFNGFISGIVDAIGWIFGLIILVGIVSFLISIGWIPALIILGIVFFISIWELLFNSSNNLLQSGLGCLGSIIKGGVVFILLIILAWGLLSIIIKSCEGDNLIDQKKLSHDLDEERSNQKIVKTNSENENSIQEEVDTLIVNTRIWKNYEGKVFEMDLITSKNNAKSSKFNRDNTKIKYNFGELYSSIAKYDEEYLNLVYKELDSIKINNSMNRKSFAELVVSMVQDIPYKLVLPTNCEIKSSNQNFTNNFLLNCIDDCCIGDIQYGVQTPIEFFSNLYGDCDTRTVSIYTILKHYNYDVGIINSDYYGHSILGINLPYNGSSYSFRGREYFFWETTQTGFPHGYISPDYNNQELWKMAITSK